MSVTVKYMGQAGNRLFQYTAARLFAEKHDLRLRCDEQPCNFFGYTEPKGKLDWYDCIRPVRESEDFMSFIHPYEGYLAFSFEGAYYQNSEIYEKYRKEVESFFILPEVTKNTKDIVMHVRLNDYWCNSWVINPSWYLKILEQEKFDVVHIVSDQPQSPYFNAFKQLPIMIHAGDARQDFHFIRSFDKIICGNSTYSWWASFLSTASKIYTFAPWVKNAPYVKLTKFRNSIPIDGDFAQ